MQDEVCAKLLILIGIITFVEGVSVWRAARGSAALAGV
jgi:hypothetical protein